tara:strand:+ start:52 stop:270 length:219 start_codon:yes stop_codon:yes gene_type:complete
MYSYQDTTDKVSNLNLVGHIRKTLEKDFEERFKLDTNLGQFDKPEYNKERIAEIIRLLGGFSKLQEEQFNDK